MYEDGGGKPAPDRTLDVLVPILVSFQTMGGRRRVARPRPATSRRQASDRPSPSLPLLSLLLASGRPSPSLPSLSLLLSL
ncbi:hypothetical protein EJ110_NYTH27065 [Nymphaea thermarum]|nr:hypothetical protein EJ110_NYTH27065 [Nymphaea thermarum]